MFLRFKPAVLDVRVNGKNIFDVLRFTVDEAHEWHVALAIPGAERHRAVGPCLEFALGRLHRPARCRRVAGAEVVHRGHEPANHIIAVKELPHLLVPEQLDQRLFEIGIGAVERRQPARGGRHRMVNRRSRRRRRGRRRRHRSNGGRRRRHHLRGRPLMPPPEEPPADGEQDDEREGRGAVHSLGSAPQPAAGQSGGPPGRRLVEARRSHPPRAGNGRVARCKAKPSSETSRRRVPARLRLPRKPGAPTFSHAGGSVLGPARARSPHHSVGCCSAVAAAHRSFQDGRRHTELHRRRRHVAPGTDEPVARPSRARLPERPFVPILSSVDDVCFRPLRRRRRGDKQQVTVLHPGSKTIGSDPNRPAVA